MKRVLAYVIFFMVQLLSRPNTVVPQKPENISCKILDFIKMVCSWDPFHSLHQTKWKLKSGIQCQKKWSLSLNLSQGRIVIWDKDTESPFRIYCKKCVQIIGRYKTGTIKSDVIKFVSDHIVELSPVNITNVQKTDSSIYIEWKHPLIERPTVCHVIYAPGPHPLQNKTKQNDSNDIHLTELSPSTSYNIWIKWKLKNSIFWSEEKSVNVVTNHAIPKSGPVITQGCYIKHKCFQSNQKCVTVYWKPIQGSFAKTKFYEISDCTDHEKVHHNMESVDAKTCSLQMKYPDFPVKSICIRANTDAGFSPYSILSLIQNRSAPPEVKTVTVEETEDPEVLLITWSYKSSYDKTQVTNVTLLWCHGQEAFTNTFVVNCEDHIEWITVEANERYRLSLAKAIEIRRFHVAVILNSKAGSRGMTWSECIFTQTGYINDLQVTFLITTFSEKMFVQWYPVGCKISVIPLVYQVAYTRQTAKHQQNPCESGSLVNVSISQTNVELKNLTSNEFYYVCMRLVTVIGPTPFSKPYLGMTDRLRTVKPWVYPVNISTRQGAIIISLTSIFAVILILICLRYLRKWCYFSVEVDIPEIMKDDEYPMNEEIVHE